MQNTELFTHLAEIAGVFVGFGALISIRSGATRDEEVTLIRMIVVNGIVVVVAALTPVTLSGFGVSGRGLWVASSVLFLVLFWGSSILNRFDPERTRFLAGETHRARVRMEIPAVPLWLTLSVALILILTGLFPDQDPALYMTAVTMNLVLTAQLLIYLVYLQRRPQPATPGEAPVGAATPEQDQETPPVG